jgi:8-oxo-dGTP diphosphatase
MEKTIFAVFINNNKEILALKRGPHKEWYSDRWDVISGKIKNETPEECLKREVLEEIGISNFEIIKKAKPHIYEESGKQWFVYPFLCKIKEGSIVLNDEHQEHKWIELQELLKLNYALPLKTELKNFFDI